MVTHVNGLAEWTNVKRPLKRVECLSTPEDLQMPKRNKGRLHKGSPIKALPQQDGLLYCESNSL